MNKVSEDELPLGLEELSADFFFFVEKLGEDPPPSADELPRLDVPVGVSHIDDLGAALVAGPADAAPCFEAVGRDRRPGVVMASPAGLVRVNGLAAPRLTVLEVGDEVQLGDAVLHLSRVRRPQVGLAPPILRGRKCGVCLVPFDDTSNVVLCDCGAGLHLDPESVAEDERLDCALLGSCPSCDQPVSLEGGVVYLPELLR